MRCLQPRDDRPDPLLLRTDALARLANVAARHGETLTPEHVLDRTWEEGRREGHRPCRYLPRQHVHGEDAGADRRILGLQRVRLVDPDAENAQPAQLARRVAERPGGEQRSRVVERREVREVRVLQLVGVRRRARDEQRDGEAVELHQASGSPVSSSVFSPLSTRIQPRPATLAAVFGAPSSWSWTTVSSETPSSPGSISHVTRLGSSTDSSGFHLERQPWTSLRGGSHSNTGSSPLMPSECVTRSVGSVWIRTP